MSGFTGNNFGDTDVNPFADPSVVQATNNAAANRGLEDYNPFADAPNTNRPQQTRGASNPPLSENEGNKQPAIMQATMDLPPAYSQTTNTASYGNQQKLITTEELQRRQEELERKAAELARKEEALRNASYNDRQNNWPPVPDRCCFQPCFYQDINVEIPVEFQKVVRTLYYLWMLHACAMLLNVMGALTLLLHVGEVELFFLAVVYCFLATPVSYVCWFRPVYKAFKSDSSFNFFVFFFIFFFQCITTGIWSLGLPSGGTCGIIRGLNVLRGGGVSNTIIGVLILLIGLLFVVITMCDVLMLTKVHNMYRSSGMSFAKAQQEFTTNIMRNEHVQSAAANAAASAVRTGLQQQPTGTRY